jgi:hypothetical protein
MVIDRLGSVKGGDLRLGIQWCVDVNSRAVVIAFLAPNQKTGNVADLFGESLRR